MTLVKVVSVQVTAILPHCWICTLSLCLRFTHQQHGSGGPVLFPWLITWITSLLLTPFTVCFRNRLALLEVPPRLLCYGFWKKSPSTKNAIELIFDLRISFATLHFSVSSPHQCWKNTIGSFCQLYPHSLSHSMVPHLLHLWLPDPCTSDWPCWFYDILICLYLKFQRNSHMDPRCWLFNAGRCFLITQMWYVSKILALFSLWIT